MQPRRCNCRCRSKGGELDLIAFDLDEVNETLRQIEY